MPATGFRKGSELIVQPSVRAIKADIAAKRAKRRVRSRISSFLM
jgi:hypothetical protein